jgi:hypothetical protein
VQVCALTSSQLLHETLDLFLTREAAEAELREILEDISVKIREGVPITNIAAHVGHSRKSLTLDSYAHVLIDG